MTNITTYTHNISNGARAIQPTLGEYYEFQLPDSDTQFHISFSGISPGLYLFMPWRSGSSTNNIYEITTNSKWGLDEYNGVSIFNNVSQFVNWSYARRAHTGTGFNIIDIHSDINIGINLKFTNLISDPVYFRLIKLLDC